MGLFKKKKPEQEISSEDFEALSQIPFQGGDSTFAQIPALSGSEDFVVLDTKKHHFKFVGKTFIIIGVSILIILLAFTVFLAMSFKLVPAHVVGQSMSIGEYSLVSRFYSPNLDEIKIGDYIIVKEPGYNDTNPVLTNISIFQVSGREGWWIFAKNEIGKVRNVESNEILYIVSRNGPDD